MLIIAPCFHQRCKQKELNLDRQKSGIASEALIDSTVSVTARQSDTVPIASEVTIALVNRADATGAGRLSKPAVRGDRIMGPILQYAAESAATRGNFTSVAGNNAASRQGNEAKSRH